MLSKLEHIQYWLKSSEEDWKTVLSLFQTVRYVHCLFFAHLALEKLCKAVWVKDNEGNIPPKIHNTIKLLSQTNAQLTADQQEYLLEANKFQLEGRYPDYINNFYNTCTLEYTEDNIKKIEEIRECLIKLLQ